MTLTHTVHQVTSLDQPGLEPYRTLRRPLEHMREGIFVGEGEKVVRRLLLSSLTVHSLLLTPAWYDSLLRDGALGSRTGIVIYAGEKELLETIVGFNLHQGIMAVGALPAERPLDEILHAARTPHLLVALDNLVNAENVGVVVRNCAAFGVDAILVGETSSSPYLRRAVRNSMGTVFGMPVVHLAHLAGTLCALHRDHGTAIVGAHPHEDATIYTAPLGGNACIVLGHEGEGLSPDILDACTVRAAIPMMNATDSINVSSASAVFLYEARRQRTEKSAR